MGLVPVILHYTRACPDLATQAWLEQGTPRLRSSERTNGLVNGTSDLPKRPLPKTHLGRNGPLGLPSLGPEDEHLWPLVLSGQALEEMHMVAEGVRATRMFVKIAPELNIEIPFLISLSQLLDGEIPVEEAVRSMVASYQD